MSWEQMQSILKENRESHKKDSSGKPKICPNDGSQLVQGPRGILNCPFGDYRWPSFSAAI
jgi:hypothetical protein